MSDFEQGLNRLGAQFVPFLFAVVAHEFGHGWMAARFGDTTAKDSGRLTLNPIPHIDPIGTLLFPILNMFLGMTVMFGWANPVPVDSRRFTRLRPGLFMVALAGPATNFILAVLSSIILFAVIRYLPDSFIFKKEIMTMTEVSVILNFGLGVFNLLPLPPLDGGRIVQSLLPKHLIYKFESLSKFGFIILLGLIFTGSIRYLGYPILLLSQLTMAFTAKLFGVMN
jgi:Zn-dependent protease